MTALEQYKLHNQLMQQVFQGIILKGEDVATLVEKIIEIVEKEQLFERDVITGRIRSLKLSDEPENLMSYEKARNTFNTFFGDKMYVVDYKVTFEGQKIPTGVKKISTQQMDVIWQQVIDVCTYNSRKELFDRIPEWDGVKRIDTFMRDYFDCETNPHFFWLFMTAVIGKIDDPAKNDVPYFFDFVGKAKGTGKSSFFEHLLGKYATNQSLSTRSKDDFLVNCYNTNSIIVNDDECCWVSKDNCSPDEFKALVSNKIDRFSRKFQQPEEHARAFVIVRTSNEPNTVFSTNERRQIIFNIGLPERTCKHWDLPQEYMNQMLAEAKAYYLENGMYKLTKDDEQDVYRQNLENYSTENSEFSAIDQFVCAVLDKESLAKGMYQRHPASKMKQGYIWTAWSDYEQWCMVNKRKAVDGRRFWRQVNAYVKYNPEKFFYEDGKKYSQENTGSRVPMLGIKDPNYKSFVDSLPDIPF